MKLKYIGVFVFSLILIITLTGCHAMYGVKIGTDKAFLKDKLFDILIHIDESDVSYTDCGAGANRVFSGKSPNYIRNTEIYSYDSDGYISMICHYRLRDYGNSEDDNLAYSVLYFDSNNEFKSVCEKYRSFKIAVLDSSGNVLSVTDKYNFMSWSSSYIESPIEYDYNKNIISYEYKYERGLGLEFLYIVILLMMFVIPLFAAVNFIIIFSLKFSDNTLPRKYHIFVFMGYCLPSIIWLALRLDEIIHTVSDKSKIMEKFFDMSHIDPLSFLYCFIPYILFFGVTIWYVIRDSDEIPH